MKKQRRKPRFIVNQPLRGNRDNPFSRARVVSGLTQKAAAEKLRICYQTLSDIENSKRTPTPNIALTMARLYNDDRLPRQICRKVCAIGRARTMPFDLNLEMVIPLMLRRFEGIQKMLNQLPSLLGGKEFAWDYASDEWELLMDYAGQIRKFSRDVEILETSVDRMIEKAEKKTAFAAR